MTSMKYMMREKRHNVDEKEEDVNYRNYNKNEKYDEEKEADKTTDYYSTTISEGKGVIGEIVRKDVDLDGFDVSTCSGDSFWGIFDKEEEIITEGSIVWENTNKTIWRGRVIKFGENKCRMCSEYVVLWIGLDKYLYGLVLEHHKRWIVSLNMFYPGCKSRF